MKFSEFHVVIVGRPNVGKSTLFNTLMGYRRSIVLDLPGTTRDEVSEKKIIQGHVLRITDSLGILSTADRTELTPLLQGADVVLFVVDSKQGVTPLDKEIAQWVRESGKPTLLCVNKSDAKDVYGPEAFYELAIDEILPIAAAHATNVDKIRDWIIGHKKDHVKVTELEKPTLSVSLIGRPNTGKSTLMNRLCRQSISKVSPEPLTTRDSVTYEIRFRDSLIRLVDTAGIRRPRSKKEQIEELSISASRKAIREADVTFLCLASDEGVSDQDMRLLNMLHEEGKPAAILLNFWDRLDSKQRKAFWDMCDFTPALQSFPFITLSGLKGENVDKVLPLALKLHTKATKRIKTSSLNRLVERIVTKNPPPSRGIQHFNILYASQVETTPPTFVFFVNKKQAVSPTYRKYLERQLQDNLSLKGHAIRIHFRER